MKLNLFILTTLIVSLIAIAPSTSAQLGVGSQTSVSDCRSFTVSSSISQVAAGSIVFCSRNPTGVANSAAGFRLGATLTTPQLTGSSPSISITLNALNGCTTSSNVNSGTSATANWGAQSSTTWMMTMAGASCTGYFRGTVISGGATVFDGVLDFTIISGDNPVYQVASGGLTITDDANGWLTNVKQDCDINPPTGDNLRWISFGACAGATVAVPDVITARNEDGTYTAQWLITWIADSTVYASAKPLTLSVTGNGFYPFESGATCDGSTIVTIGQSTGSQARTDGRYRTGHWYGTINFSGSGCTVLYGVDGATHAALIPITVRSEGYTDQTTNSVIDGNVELSGDIGFNGTFNSTVTNNGNTTIIPAYQETEEYAKAQWLSWFFIGLAILAEWRKDAIYHLLAGIVGALGVASGMLTDVLGIPRLFLLSVVVYQFWRLYKVVGNNRNNIQASEASAN
jgi:hypothetical protein